jgi:hypothetical protein
MVTPARRSRSLTVVSVKSELGSDLAHAMTLGVKGRLHALRPRRRRSGAPQERPIRPDDFRSGLAYCAGESGDEQAGERPGEKL